MNILITTRTLENYGAHTWDGEGECPVNWRRKAGYEYLVTDAPDLVSPFEVAALVVPRLKNAAPHYIEQIEKICILHEDVTPGEYSQMEEFGEIDFPATRIAYADLVADA